MILAELNAVIHASYNIPRRKSTKERVFLPYVGAFLKNPDAVVMDEEFAEFRMNDLKL
jgi:hypothetical protein